jgi:hypothetical protein
MPLVTPLLLTLLTANPPATEAMLWQPEVMVRDVAIIAAQLQIDAAQRVVLEDLVANYEMEFEAAASSTRRRLDAMAPEMDVPGRDWIDQHRQWTDIRAEAGSMDQDDASVYLEAMRLWASDELNSILEDTPPPALSARGQVLSDWLDTREALRSQTLSDAGLMLNDAKRSRWPVADARLRFLHPLDTSTHRSLPSEHIDLSRILSQQFGDDLPDDLASELDAYVVAHGAILAARDKALAGIIIARADADSRDDRVALLELAMAEAAVRVNVSNDTFAWYDRLSRMLSDADAIKFQRQFNHLAWPEIFGPSRADRIIAWALRQDNLDPSTADSLRLIRARRGAQRLSVAANERKARRSADARRPVLVAQQQAMAEVFGPSALFAIEEESDDSLQRAVKLARQREVIETAATSDVRNALGDAWWSQIPQSTHSAPHEQRLLPVDEDGNPMPMEDG